MDEVQQSLNARKKSQKKTRYEDILETLRHSFKCNYGYHTKCYKNFTAVSVSQSAKGRKKYKGNIIDIGKCETFDAEVTIRNAAKYLKDKTLLAKIGSYEFGNGPDFATMEAKYHYVCKRETRDTKNSEKSNLSSEKKTKSAALNDLNTFVNKSVIEKTHQRKYLSC